MLLWHIYCTHVFLQVLALDCPTNCIEARSDIIRDTVYKVAIYTFGNRMKKE